MTDYYLDTLKAGAGPGNHGADFAVFRPAYTGILPRDALRHGRYEMNTADWIKRGRPTRIEVFLGPEDLTT